MPLLYRGAIGRGTAQDGKRATETGLRQALAEHLEKTKVHLERIETAFALLNMEPETMKVKGINGIISDAEWLINNIDPGSILDASLISAGIDTEHYEIGSYMTAEVWADTLGYEEIRSILEDTLEEEKTAADELMNLSPQSAETASKIS